MDELRFTNAVEMDNDADIEIEESEEVVDRINTLFQSRSAPEMVTRSTFPTRTAFQEPTVEGSRGLRAEATGSITDTVWPDLRIKYPELAAKVQYPVSATTVTVNVLLNNITFL